MDQRISDHVVVEILDSIYGTVTGECDWATVVNHISSAVPHAKVCMHGYDLKLNKNYFETCQKWDQNFVDSYSTHYCTTSPWIAGHVARPVGTVYTSRDIEPDLAAKHPEFYHDWVEPAGIGSGTAVKLFGDGEMHSAISLDYKMRSTDTSDELEIQFLQRLKPHLQRAISIQRNLELIGGAHRNLQTLLEKLPTPALLLNSDCHVEWMNCAATNAVHRARGIMLTKSGQLKLAELEDNQKLGRLVHRASTRSADLPTQALGTFPFRAASETSEPNLISVTPLADGHHGSGSHLTRFITPDWRALVIIRYRADKPVVPDEQLRMAFGLTSAEARIVQALVQDERPAQIAANLKISEHTVRNQLKRAMAKTECHRQTELVRLVMSLLAPP